MLVPMLNSIIRNAAAAGTREVVIGMAHRGRLNVLAHVLGKPYAAILAEFHAANRDAGAAPSGKGTHRLGRRREVSPGRAAGLQGERRRVRCRSPWRPTPATWSSSTRWSRGAPARPRSSATSQARRPQDKRASLAILIHGDAAFPGQGIVAETLNLSRLAGYSTGGTIHIITNNQIGFTTEPSDARSTLYASDLAKGFEIPIVHVNADDSRPASPWRAWPTPTASGSARTS